MNSSEPEVDVDSRIRSALHEAANGVDPAIPDVARFSIDRKRSRRKRHQRIASVAALSVGLLTIGAVAGYALQSQSDRDAAPIATEDDQTTTTAPSEPLPSILESAVSPDAPPWSGRSAWPLEGSTPQVAAWTGTEVLVWAGSVPMNQPEAGTFGQILSYDPASDSWRILPEPPAPVVLPSSIWTPEGLVAFDRDGTAVLLDRDLTAWTDLGSPPTWRDGFVPFNPRVNRLALSGDRVVAPLGGVSLSVRTGEWEVLPELPPLDFISGVEATEDDVLVLGGHRDSEYDMHTKALLRLNTGSNVWEVLPAPPMFGSALALRAESDGSVVVASVDASTTVHRLPRGGDSWLDVGPPLDGDQPNCIPRFLSGESLVLDLCTRVASFDGTIWAFVETPSYDDRYGATAISAGQQILSLSSSGTWQLE